MPRADQWKEAIRLSKIQHGLSPDSFVKLDSKVLRKAQEIYIFLDLKQNKISKNSR